MKGITSNTTIAIIIDCLSCPNLYIHGEKTNRGEFPRSLEK